MLLGAAWYGGVESDTCALGIVLYSEGASFRGSDAGQACLVVYGEGSAQDGGATGPGAALPECNSGMQIEAPWRPMPGTALAIKYGSGHGKAPCITGWPAVALPLPIFVVVGRTVLLLEVVGTDEEGKAWKWLGANKGHVALLRHKGHSRRQGRAPSRDAARNTTGSHEDTAAPTKAEGRARVPTPRSASLQTSGSWAQGQARC